MIVTHIIECIKFDDFGQPFARHAIAFNSKQPNSIIVQ